MTFEIVQEASIFMGFKLLKVSHYFGAPESSCPYPFFILYDIRQDNSELTPVSLDHDNLDWYVL